MNFKPNQDDHATPADGIDESLLDQALAEQAPDELEAKILALTDPQMLALLDEAMAPEPNEQLNDRILAATSAYTSPRLAGSAARRAGIDSPPNVLARIGPMRLRYAAAAAILLAIGMGTWLANQAPDEAGPSISDATGATDVEPDGIAEEGLPDWVSDERYASNDDYFQSATSPLEQALKDVTDSLDGVSISRDTLWAELDAYEQFLDDVES